MRGGVRHRQHAAPRVADEKQSLLLEMHPQRIEVRDDVPEGHVLRGHRGELRASCPSLFVEDSLIGNWHELADRDHVVDGEAGASAQKDDGRARTARAIEELNAVACE